VTLYQEALSKYYPAQSGITYAGKAYLCLALAQWTRQHNLWLDCTGQGEIAIAVAAGVGRDHLLVHGVNKSPQDLEAAFQHAGTIVVDNMTELERVVTMSAGRFIPDLWLRFQPGVMVETHAHIQTGQAGSKFGMDREHILKAVELCRQHALPLKGCTFTWARSSATLRHLGRASAASSTWRWKSILKPVGLSARVAAGRCLP